MRRLTSRGCARRRRPTASPDTSALRRVFGAGAWAGGAGVLGIVLASVGAGLLLPIGTIAGLVTGGLLGSAAISAGVGSGYSAGIIGLVIGAGAGALLGTCGGAALGAFAGEAWDGAKVE